MVQSLSERNAGRRRHRDVLLNAMSLPDTERVQQAPVEVPAEAPVEAVQQNAVSEALQRGRHIRLRFPAALEAAFQADQADSRRRHLLVAGFVGALTYGSFAITDAQVMPDVAELSWRLHTLIVPMMLLGTAVSALRIKPWLREMIYASNAAITAIAIVITISFSRLPAAMSHVSSLFLVPMFAGVAARLSFRHTLLVSMVTIEGMLMIQPLDNASRLLLRDAQMIAGSAVFMSLLASYALEYHERLRYLHQRLEAQQHEALADANTRLQRLATVDALTGVFNRRQFESDLSAHWVQAAESGRKISLLIADVDHFKLYNDGYGHPTGDICLRSVASALNDVAIKAGGSLARLGGEEFGVLLPDGVAAADVAATAVLTVSALRLPHRLSPVSDHVTISVGHATLSPTSGQLPTILLENADHALYRAKLAGRNRASGETAADVATAAAPSPQLVSVVQPV